MDTKEHVSTPNVAATSSPPPAAPAGESQQEVKSNHTSNEPANTASSPPTSITTKAALDEKGEHLLENHWTFWFSKKLPKSTKPAEYAGHLQKIASFHTVEEFYRYDLTYYYYYYSLQ